MPLKFNLRDGISGLVSTGIPFIFKGMVNEWLAGDEHHPPIDVHAAVAWVTGNKDLLVLFKEYGGQDFDNVLARAGSFIKDSSWLTGDWLIDACRDEHPDIASLFLGWEEGRVWLDMQVEKFRDAFDQVNNPLPPAKTVIPPVTPGAPLSTSNAPPASYKPIKGAENAEPLQHLV
jgi:hypothetical protein